MAFADTYIGCFAVWGLPAVRIASVVHAQPTATSTDVFLLA
jgi:hypothetical protein